MNGLLKDVFASMQIPKLQTSERLSRSLKVLDTQPISNPSSAQGGDAVWNVSIHQPKRESEPTLDISATQDPEEWEEAP